MQGIDFRNGLCTDDKEAATLMYGPDTCFSGWRSIAINLSSLATKHIKHIFVVYDNPGGSGDWRSWIDNIRITY